MLLPEIKEREYRFRLALRIGLPIFALVIALVSHTLISNYESLQASFYFESVLLLTFSVYFIFYLLYNGFNVKIKDDVSSAFSREYFYEYLKKEIRENKEYTLVLISIENLDDINHLYGLKNGDKILSKVVIWANDYFEEESIGKIPIGHIKGGDFIIGFKGNKEKYNILLELLCLKSSEFKIDNIEVKISVAITDTNYSHGLNYMTENLFELLEINKMRKSKYKDEIIDPSELELLVIEAIKNVSISTSFQAVFKDKEKTFNECFVKLQISNNKFLYPKRYMKVINKLGLSVAFDIMLLEEISSKCILNSNEVYAINISPASLRNEKFLSSTKEIFKNIEGSAEHMIFILAEQEYYSFISRYNHILNSLRSLGVKIAIDRVGALHTSFLYLRELEIDIIRFDSYYSKDTKLKENLSIIEGFNLMAQEKGIKSWIKNLEDADSLGLAKDMKIDYLQGKHLANLEKKS